MSGLRPVPRIPKRCSTMNGSEASASPASAGAIAERRAAPVSLTRGTT